MEENEQQVDWKRRYNSLVLAISTLERKIEDLTGHNGLLLRSLEIAQSAVDLNKKMLRDGLEDFNRKEQEYVVRINDLKTKLKELGYGDFR